ncbi:hypothetical protein AXF42_Ash014662 [Apostasia shenzhenica]|uniref:RING-type domain-containing protein n=1 Tax=Apostasia shenzhenica TaxID=1088818 RepID=A0A2I0AKB1_9ASPA|nr:hypothetical protein AXF42_Ash014662 [Apostasia shenzhenica]
MRKSFKDSLKALEADIQHANTLASEFQKEYGGAHLHMKMSYSPIANLFLFLVKWTNCSLAGSLGLLRILIHKGQNFDGRGMESPCERKASMKEFYAIIFPSLIHLQKGITDVEDRKQKALCIERYRKRADDERKYISEINAEREEECGICMEMNSRIVLPNCFHAMCMQCYNGWNSRQQSCPFCRENLRGVKPADLWVYTDSRDVVDVSTITRENLRRLYLYIDKLPLMGPSPTAVFHVDDSHMKASSSNMLIPPEKMN